MLRLLLGFFIWKLGLPPQLKVDWEAMDEPLPWATSNSDLQSLKASRFSGPLLYAVARYGTLVLFRSVALTKLSSAFSVQVDRFFVDGRARPQCAVEALFHFRDPNNAFLFMHDFWDTQQRGHYRLVLLVYDLVDTVLGELCHVPDPSWFCL